MYVPKTWHELRELLRMTHALERRMGESGKRGIDIPLVALESFIRSIEDPGFHAPDIADRDERLCAAYHDASGTAVSTALLIPFSGLAHLSRGMKDISKIYLAELTEALEEVWSSQASIDDISEDEQLALLEQIKQCLRPPLEAKLTGTSIDSLGDVLLRTTSMVFFLLIYTRLSGNDGLLATIEPLQDLLQQGIVPIGHDKTGDMPPHCVVFQMNA